MDTLPVTRLEELDQHLDELSQKPDTPIDAQLFDHVELQLTEANIPHIMPRLLPKVATILKTYQSDPLALCNLALKLLQATTFSQVFTITSEDDIVAALRSPAPSANMLAMAILDKAAASPAEVSILSVSTPLVTEFLIRWLSAPQVEVGERGIRTLIDLLDTDCDLSHPRPNDAPGGADRTELEKRKVPGHGKLWRRLLQDRDVFALLIDLCEGKHFDDESCPHQRSLAQGRFLRVIPRLALINFAALTRCDFPELLPRRGGRAGPPDSLLHYVANRMVDREDPLMRLSLIDFVETLVCATRLSEYSPYKVETMRGLLRDLTALDPSLTSSLQTLPDRVIPEEADALRSWINEIVPAQSRRVR